MKQLYAISSFLCLAALLAASCTTSLTDEPDTTARAIAFSTPQAGTRAAVTSSADMRDFSVWGGYDSSVDNVFNNETVHAQTWTYSGGTRYWIPGKTYNFYAVHPAGLNASVNASGTITVTDFDCSKTGSEAVDLMTATAPGDGDNPEKVAMEFQHELAKVKFIVVSEGDAITLTNAKLYGVSHKGSLNGKIWTPDAVSRTDDTPFQTSSLEIADTQEHQEMDNKVVQEKTGEAVQEQMDETPQVVRRISGKQRRASLEEYKDSFLPVPSIEDRKPVFLSRSTRDALDRIVRMFGERKMSVSGLVENIARQHLAIYGEDIEAWRKL